MSNRDTVRTIISDFPQYTSANSIGDGFTTEYPYPYAPIIPGTLKVYLNRVKQSAGFTEDDNLGVVNFAASPAENVRLDFSAQSTLLTDAQIDSILSLYPDSEDADAIKLAAADCLDIIASSEVLIQKKIKMLDLEVDGPALAKSLRDHAESLRKQVLTSNESVFDLAEQINDTAGFREKIVKDWMRQ